MSLISKVKRMDQNRLLVICLIGIFALTYYIYHSRPYQVNIQYSDRETLAWRGDIGKSLENLRFKTMIEIGVASGNFAFKLLNNWPSFTHYYGIDAWKHQENYTDLSNLPDTEHEENYKTAVEQLKIYGDRIRLIKKFSSDAVSIFQDESIDFIYLDSRNDYCNVMQDLSLFYPKLKCDGIMAGHNFLSSVEQLLIKPDSDYSVCSNGQKVLKSGGCVKGAVLDFIKEKNIEDILVTKEMLPSFFFFKKCE